MERSEKRFEVRGTIPSWATKAHRTEIEKIMRWATKDAISVWRPDLRRYLDGKARDSSFFTTQLSYRESH